MVNGTVYGDVTLTADRTIDDLTIPAGTSLTVPEGKTLTVNGTVTNSGTLTVFDDSSLAGTGTLTGSGDYKTTPDVVAPTSLVETGGDLTAAAEAATSLGGEGFTLNGVSFIADTTGWTGPTFTPATVKDA